MSTFADDKVVGVALHAEDNSRGNQKEVINFLRSLPEMESIKWNGRDYPARGRSSSETRERKKRHNKEKKRPNAEEL